MCDFLTGFFEGKNLVYKLVISGRAAGGGRAGGALLVNVWLKFLQIRFSRKVFNLHSSNFTHVFSGSLLSCDVMFISVGSHFFCEKCIVLR